MECLNGKTSSCIGADTLTAQLARYRHVTIDIGTGDGRYVTHLAHMHPSHFVIGVDACRDPLRVTSRRAPKNALFVIANALALPTELAGHALTLTINFPWGSLLSSLLAGDARLLDGLCRISRPGTLCELRLNASALCDIGVSIRDGGRMVQQGLHAHGWHIGQLQILDAVALRAYPTTWAKRLAFGCDPHALYVQAWTPIQPSLVSSRRE